MQEWLDTAGMFLFETTVSVFCSSLCTALTTVLLKTFESAVSNMMICHHVQFFSFPKEKFCKCL